MNYILFKLLKYSISVQKKGTENTIIVNANLEIHKIFQEYVHKKKFLLWRQMLSMFALA